LNISATAQSVSSPASTSSAARFTPWSRIVIAGREFIEFLKLLDAAYPADTAIKLILDNHSAHISKETKAWLAHQPAHRFEFTFTPTHGSWLNLIEGFFSKLTRSVLRHIRVGSKQELKDRLIAAMDFFNQQPVVHTWTYKLDQAA
jgi:transposase